MDYVLVLLFLTVIAKCKHFFSYLCSDFITDGSSNLVQHLIVEACSLHIHNIWHNTVVYNYLPFTMATFISFYHSNRLWEWCRWSSTYITTETFSSPLVWVDFQTRYGRCRSYETNSCYYAHWYNPLHVGDYHFYLRLHVTSELPFHQELDVQPNPIEFILMII